MTAKELLLKEATRWSEHDAEVALAAVRREHRDPTIEVSDEDEEISREEEAAAAAGRADIAAGRTVSLEEIKNELGLA
jgi:predicted transcriptional regulator